MKHEAVEKNIGLLAFFMVIAVSVGGLTQIVPLFFQDVTNKPVEGMKPRTALELEGRDVYIANREVEHADLAVDARGTGQHTAADGGVFSGGYA
ncbi:Cbb3-type cytochrome oxidase, cytochrome c subunit, partial [Pseudomonas sp. GM33]|uniref:cbb3-type cytochrome c oxidase subunit II n=1 Tax=Pseudomonas sp. GM33 TaxID=1144329 RepID=UPI000270551A